MKTKNEYMRELARRIRSLPADDRRELLADYEAHFAAGHEAGKSEEEICRSLGSTRSVAQEILATTWVKHIDSSSGKARTPKAILHMMLMILVLAPFNFLMLICPFLILFIMVFVGWTIPLSIGAAAIFAFFSFWQIGTGAIGFLVGASLVFMLLGTLGVAALGALTMYVCTRGAFKLLFSFFRWNLNVINMRRTNAPALAGGNT